MGFELDRLMKLYGVSTPTIAAYGGSAAPTDATATDYATKQAQYAADQALYNKYVQDYKDRMLGTQMYRQPQYMTNPDWSYGNRDPLLAPQYRPVNMGNPPATGGGGTTGGGTTGGGTTGGGTTGGGTVGGGGGTGSSGGTGGNGTGPNTGWYDPGQLPGGNRVLNNLADQVTSNNVNQSNTAGDLYGTLGLTGSDYMFPVSTGGSPMGDFQITPDMLSMLRDKYAIDSVAFAKGGYVKTRYADGGEADLPNPTDLPVVSAPQPGPQQPMPQGAPMQAPQSRTPPPDLMAMLQRYTGGDQFRPQLQAASEKAARESDAFAKMLSDAMSSQASTAPSQEEMYWRLASAFGAPTKTGNFFENLSAAGKEMAEYKKAERAATAADRAVQLQLGLKAQEMRMQGAKEELSGLRQLAGEEAKGKQAIAVEMLKEWAKTGEPQSAAGKQAQDEGLTPGTTQYQKRVAQLSEVAMDAKLAQIQSALASVGKGQAELALAQQKFENQKQQQTKLTPSEMKMKSDTETTLLQTDQALNNLKQAYSLNPNTFDNSLVDLAKRKVLENTKSDDPRVLATRTQENLLSGQALEQLRATFGGNPTEGERKILLDVQGIGAKSKEERAAIMRNTYNILKAKREQQAKRLNEINSGLYRDTTVPTAGIPGELQ